MSDYGTDLDRLRARVVALERAMAGKAQANPALTVEQLVGAGGRPAPPSGLTPVNSTTPGLVSFTWNAAPVTDLLHYEIQYADRSDFGNILDTRLTTNTFGDFSGLADSSGLTVWARVRSVNQEREVSNWSSSVSSEGGVLTAGSVGVGELSSIHEYHQTGGFVNLANGASGVTISDIYGPLPISTQEFDVVIPRIIVQYILSAGWVIGQNYLYMEFLRRPDTGGPYTLIEDAYQDALTISGGGPIIAPGRAVAAAFTTFDEPGDGNWEYFVRWSTFSTLGSTNYIDATPFDVRMEFIKNARMAT